MQSPPDVLPGPGNGQYCCYDGQYRSIFHGPEQRYVSPTTGKCRPLVVQAVAPKFAHKDRKEVPVGGNVPKAKKLAVWLVTNPPTNGEEIARWLMRWAWFSLSLIWPFTESRHTGFYSPYLSRYQRYLWAARSPFEHSMRTTQSEKSVREITHAPYPRKLVIYDSETRSWRIQDNPDVIKQQRYVAISYRYEDVVPHGVREMDRIALEEAFKAEVEAAVLSLEETAYWIDMTLINTKEKSPEGVNQDLYRMADVYRGAQFTLIMLCPRQGVTQEKAWLEYGNRLWTFPEALLSKKLRFKFRGGDITPITLHQFANRAYPDSDLAEESAIINAYGLRDPLERLERLSLLKSALWRRTSRTLREVETNPGTTEHLFRAERVYALMGFFEHRIHPDLKETQWQALVRLSMANDNDRIVERMVCLLPAESEKIFDIPGWYAEQDAWGAKLWDIDPEIQVVGMTQNQALVLGGCRAAAIRWKDFPSIAFATRRSFKRWFADYLPNLAWEILLVGILLEIESFPGAAAPIVIGVLLMLAAPLMKAYGVSGRIVQAQPWLIGVKGLISADEAAILLYGGAIGALPRTFYSPSGTPLSKPEKGLFRRGDASQLDDIKSRTNAEDLDKLYTLVDTVSATVYYFRAERPPTVCLYTGRDSGMGRFVLCSERCTINELHKETVVRMPWYISQRMPACDWVALG